MRTNVQKYGRPERTQSFFELKIVLSHFMGT